MSEIDNIYEITRRLSSPENIREDMREAVSLVARHFTGKYLNPVEAAVSAHRQYCNTHPTREINLLTALKPFFTDTGDIERLIEGFNTYRLVQDLRQNTITTQEINDPAIHPDGIYEIDEGCIGADVQGLTEGIRWELLLLILLLKR